MHRKPLLIFLGLILISSCKKPESGVKMAEVGGAKKYAKYKVVVNKDTDLKDWLATLEKAEEVTVLEETSIKSKKGKEIKLSRVKLSDDKTGYIESTHLGNEPLVFIKNTKAYIRPSPLVKVYAEIPEGKIGFIVDQKDGWTQIYVGKIGDTWVTSQWVEDGSFSKDTNLLIDAKVYENALDLLKEKKDEAENVLKDLRENARTDKFKEMAEKALSPVETINENKSTESPESPDNTEIMN